MFGSLPTRLAATVVKKVVMTDAVPVAVLTLTGPGALLDDGLFVPGAVALARPYVDGAPVWHFVSRRGAGCCLLTPEIQTNGRRLFHTVHIRSMEMLLRRLYSSLKGGHFHGPETTLLQHQK